MEKIQKQIQAACCSTSVDKTTGAIHPPVYRTTTFQFSDESLESFQKGLGKKTFLYSRYSNPTIYALEKKLAAIQSAEDAIAFASGMGAIFTTLLTFFRPNGKWFISRELYGVTYSLIQEEFTRLGVIIEWFDPNDVQTLYELGKATNPDLIFFETLSNPLTKVADLPSIVEFAKLVGAITIVDNTFASPWNCCPILHGVDLVIESGSKYLNGHSDVICGMVAGNQALVQCIWKQMTKIGTNLSVEAAALWERGLRTFPLRMKQCSDSAFQLSKWLQSVEDVEKVFYPHNWNDLKWLMGGSGVLAFLIKGGNERAKAILKHLKVIVPATSLGGTESLVSLPFNTSHVHFNEIELNSLGILPGTIRLAVGLEPIDVLQCDLQQAIEATRNMV
ncbi:MAG: PLP-dependent aspartate aminotransferase family protein [bacterium]|nr:PLP-dependent aspartate aminotransferase family protein [bacterium]